jgi:hypothetical protein
MKENQVEFIFIGIIIIVFALWNISQIIKTRCYEAASARAEAGRASSSSSSSKSKEGLLTIAAVTAARKDPQLIEKVSKLIKKSLFKEPFSNNVILSTEGFTTETTENEMTIHQRRKAATLLDGFDTNNPSTAAVPEEAAIPPSEPTPPPLPPVIKEGLENADEQSRAIIEKNITSMNPDDSQSKFKFRDYYIKAAYNAFNPYKFKNSTVSMDALLYVIARGCRFIDFEVFSVDNEPVIGSSSVNSFNYKETFNHIPVAEAFEVLGSYVFSGAKCPNPSDPFIIHMRMMSRNITMYDKLANVIAQSKTVARNLLGPKYGREYQSKDLGNENILDFRGKIILMVDGTNQVYRNTKLFELINMSSNSLFLSKHTYFGVKNIGDPQAFKDANKKNMCLVIPDKAGRPLNEGHNGPYTWGCQIAAMCFQEEARDEKFKAYEDKFASVGYAFILKPEDLRYVPITIAPPAPPNPNSSMETRPTEAAGGVKISL